MNTIFCAMLLCFSIQNTLAKTHNFFHTGQILAIVSETEPENGSLKYRVNNAEFKLLSNPKSRLDFYFTYKIFEDGKSTEKWIELPNDRVWNQHSNQSVQIKGNLKHNKLLDIEVSPLTELSAENLTNPPPTNGLYKVVTIPLTIQTQSQGTNDQVSNSLSVTPKEIRDNFFNAPNSVNKFYLEASYGKFGFTGVHHPQGDVVPVTIAATISTDCQNQIVTEFTETVRNRLQEQNIDTTNGDVDLGIIIFNDTQGCPPYPFATRGALGQRGAPLWVWMPESWFATGPAILAHEIGHALGGNHPLSAQCTNFDDPQTCVYLDAADRDLMTSGGRFYMMPNNYERRRWGWHPPGAFDNPSSGSVYMFDLHSPILPFIKSGLKQGRFFFRNMKGVHEGWDIYPEARRNWGQFEKYQATDEAFRSGITVRYGHSNYGHPDVFSILIDPNDTPEVKDAPLRKDQQFSMGGVLIKCMREHNPHWGTRMRVQ